MIRTITIVTPSYNQGQFIEETIQSVLSQEGYFKIDYIIADGGSSDNTVSIIKKYDSLLKENKINIKCKGISYRWWSHPDKGQANAINSGLKISNGDILTWLNSDDTLEPGSLEYISQKFNENPKIDLVYGNCFSFWEKSNEKEVLKIEPTNFKKFLKRGDNICQPAAFFTKRIVDKVGILDEKLNYVIDYDLWLRIMKTSQSMYVNKTLANFRLWTDSKTCSQQDKIDIERKKLLKKYGGNIIDPKTIYKIQNKLPLLKFLRNKTPKLYTLIKKIFYLILDNLHFKNKWNPK